MPSTDDAWRVIGHSAVLNEAALQGRRVVERLEAADLLCARVFEELGDAHAGLEDPYHAVRAAITVATSEVSRAAVRLSYIAG